MTEECKLSDEEYRKIREELSGMKVEPLISEFEIVAYLLAMIWGTVFMIISGFAEGIAGQSFFILGFVLVYFGFTNYVFSIGEMIRGNY